MSSAVLATLVNPGEVHAGTQTFVDPNGNTATGAWTKSVCNIVGTAKVIDYEIENETMENLYTIDWNAPPMRVTLVPSNGTRRSIVTGLTACPERPGSVKWIDAPDTAVPSRGTQIFPAPAQINVWTTFEPEDVSDFLIETGGQPFTQSTLFDDADDPLLTFTSGAKPKNPTDPFGEPWTYTYTVVNHSNQSHSFRVTALQPNFVGFVGPGQSAQSVIQGSEPCGIKPGAVHIEDTGEIFPATAFIPKGCPGAVGGVAELPDAAGVAALEAET